MKIKTPHNGGVFTATFEKLHYGCAVGSKTLSIT